MRKYSAKGAEKVNGESGDWWRVKVEGYKNKNMQNVLFSLVHNNLKNKKRKVMPL